MQHPFLSSLPELRVAPLKSQSLQLVNFMPRPEASFRLFCFPHAGAAPIAFFPLSGALNRDIECICVQYAGRGQRLAEKPLTSIGEIARSISRDLSEFSDKPFAFYGHSFGGIVAFELARELRRSGRSGPEQLCVGAAHPPHLEPQFSPIHMLPEREFIDSVQSRYGGIPAVISGDSEVMEIFLPAMRGDFTAYETYRYQPEEALAVPIAAFGGTEDQIIEPECLCEWQLHTDVGFDMKLLPGGHFFPATSLRELVCALEGHIAARRSELNSTFAG